MYIVGRYMRFLGSIVLIDEIHFVFLNMALQLREQVGYTICQHLIRHTTCYVFDLSQLRQFNNLYTI